MPTVSVIIPCFDIVRYVDDCVRSVVDQTFADLEVVLVDDGSNDGTAERIDLWVKKDDRVRSVRQSNRGLGAARNTGLDHCSGDYVMFVDGDDMLPVAAVEQFVRSLEQSGSDFASGTAWRFDADASWRVEQYGSAFDESVYRTHLFAEPSLVSDQMACSKMFRREFWDSHGLRFPEGVLYEDIVVVMQAHCAASAIDIIAEPSYLWRRRDGGPLSITQDRHRRGSTRARFEGLLHADQVLRRRAPYDVWVAHGMKVINHDLRLYSRILEGAGDDFTAEFLDGASRLVSELADGSLAGVNRVMQQLCQFVINRDVDGILACVRLMAGSDGRSARRVIRGSSWLARHHPGALARIVAATGPAAVNRVRALPAR